MLHTVFDDETFRKCETCMHLNINILVKVAKQLSLVRGTYASYHELPTLKQRE